MKSYCDMSGEPLIDGLIVGSENTKLSETEMENVRSLHIPSKMVTDRRFHQLADVRIKDQKDYLRRWCDADVDALITPVQTFTGFRPRTWVRSKQWVGYTAVWNWLGYASLAMPVTTVTAENAAADEEWATHVPRNDSDQFNWENCTCPFSDILPVLDHDLCLYDRRRCAIGLRHASRRLDCWGKIWRREDSCGCESCKSCLEKLRLWLLGRNRALYG